MDADEPEINEELTSIVTAVLFGTAVIFGLIGNLLAVLVVSCNANMRSITNILIVSLSVADLLFIIFCVPFTGTQFVLGYWPFGNVWCMAVQYIIAVTAFASVYTLVLMSFHRYLAVVHPVDFLFLRTEKSWIVTILIMWGIIIAYNVRTSLGLRHPTILTMEATLSARTSSTAMTSPFSRSILPYPHYTPVTTFGLPNYGGLPQNSRCLKAEFAVLQS
ncbi:unnamed protein product [Nesidiocoris tenuis]|uniref:G-protein coupled receptors family 1 profile domain-containing protein n=1 Tax=Nesidiocoris tenuis TaxID=355587 RepID=A0A6H5G960_9HEMI|nr:unnamed protein product [Nesidiocoris tenuis]